MCKCVYVPAAPSIQSTPGSLSVAGTTKNRARRLTQLHPNCVEIFHCPVAYIFGQIPIVKNGMVQEAVVIPRGARGVQATTLVSGPPGSELKERISDSPFADWCFGMSSCFREGQLDRIKPSFGPITRGHMARKCQAIALLHAPEGRGKLSIAI